MVIDATGKPAVGADIGLTAMEHGKHLVMMNVEADVTIGAYLQHEAKRLGVVYTLGAGDEPSSCMELINFVTGLGYPIVAAGKGKNNPLNIDATPDDYMEEAKRRNMNPRMLVEFVDGSKTMVEMAAIANATGLVPDCPGMHGPAAGLSDLEKVLCPKEDGGVLSRKGVVDYSIGKGVAPGVFVIAEMSHPRVRERMHDLKLGTGPYYTFYRPYHLTSLEVPLSCARAVLYKHRRHAAAGRSLVGSLRRGQEGSCARRRLDAIGEYTYRAWIMTGRRRRCRQGHPLRPAGKRQGDEADQEGRAADLCQLRCRCHRRDRRAAPEAGRHAEGNGGMNAVGTIKPNARPFFQKYSAEALKEALRRMYLIRRFEEGAEEAYMRGLIHGTMHLSIGQEASAVGSTMALRNTDYITSTHRGHGHCIGKGADPKLMFAEFFGKEEGYCRGRGGSMHIADVATRQPWRQRHRRRRASHRRGRSTRHQEAEARRRRHVLLR